MVSLKIGQWFSKLKVGQKIGLGYGVMLAITIAGTTAGIVLMQYYQHQADAIEKDVLEEFQLTSRLQNSLLQMRVHTWELISLEMGSEDFKEVYNHFLKHDSDFKERWVYFEKSERVTKGKDEQEILGELGTIKEFTSKYKDVINTYIKELDVMSQQLHTSNFNSESIKIIKLKLIELNQSDLLAKVDEFSDNLIEVDDTLKKEYNQAKKAKNTLKILQLEIIVAVLFISGIIATILAIATTKAIARPIQSLTIISQRAIEESNFDLQAKVETKDEVGLLVLCGVNKPTLLKR